MSDTSSDSPRTLAASVPAGAPFFSVSVAKLIVLSTCTLGLYEVFWFYKNWRLVRQREGSDILPFWRAFFAFFFCYAMFRRVRDFPVQPVATETLPVGLLTVGWILTTCLIELPDPYSLLSFAAVLFIIPVQLTAIRVNEAVAPGHDRNEKFTLANVLTVAVGGVVFVLAVVAAFLPEQ